MEDTKAFQKEGLAEIFGAGTPLHLERPLLFLAAWFTANLALMPLTFYRMEDSAEWSTRAPSPWEVLAALVSSLVLVLLALGLLKVLGNVWAAVALVAVLYSLVSRPIYATAFRLQVAGSDFYEGDSPAFAWFDFRIFTSVAGWYLVFFLVLGLSLVLLKSRWTGLLAGAAGGAALADLGRMATAAMFGESEGWDYVLFFLGKGVAEQLLFALLLIVALAIASPGAEEPRVRRAFYLGTPMAAFFLTLTLSLMVILMTATGLWQGEEMILPMVLLLVLATAVMMYGAVVFMVLVYRMWASIQDGHARTTPGRALGFLFIPLFNLYWAFQAFRGFASDYNAYTLRHGLKEAPTLKPGLFTAYILLAFSEAVPVLGVLLVPATFVVGMVMVSRICAAVNAVPPAGEPATLN